MILVDQELTGGAIPPRIRGVEVRPVGGGGVSEMMEPQSQNLLLFVLLQCPYHLLQHQLHLTPFPEAQDRSIGAVAASA